MTAPSKAAVVSWSALFAADNRYKAIALAAGVLLHVSNIYIATTVMPSIVKEIGGLAFYAWNTTLFVIASIMGAVFSARLLSVAGPRVAYRTAIIIFIVGTVCCTFSPTMMVLLLGRFIQGLGGGLLFALSYAVIRIVFEERLWARSMALVSAMWGIGAFVGPFVGGIFAEHDNWRMAFGSIIVLSLGLLTLTEKLLPRYFENSAVARVPVFKLVLLVGAALSVSVGSLYTSIWVNGIAIAVAILLMGILVYSESRKGARLLPTGAYQAGSPLFAVYLVMALFSIVAAVEIFIPYFAQAIYGYSPLQAGYLAVLVALGWSFGSITFSGLPGHYVGKLILAGAILLSVGLYGLSLLSHENLTITELVLLCIALFATGTGIGVAWPHLMVKVFSLAPDGQQELTSASITTIQLLSMTFGAALGGLVANLGGMTHPGGLEGAKSATALLYSFYMKCPLIVLLLMVIYKQFRRNLFGR